MREPPPEGADDELCIEPVFIDPLFVDPPLNDPPLRIELPLDDPPPIEELREGAELGKLCAPPLPRIAEMELPLDPRMAEIALPFAPGRIADCPAVCPGRIANSPVTGFMLGIRTGIGVACTRVVTNPSRCACAFTLLKS